MDVKRTCVNGILCLFLLLLTLPSWTIAAEPFTLIGPTELKALIDRHESPVQIIDSRSVAEFQEAHIREAINVTSAAQETNPQSLPFKKTERLVFYCNGFS